MSRVVVVVAFLLATIWLWASDEKQESHPSFEYDVARAHEIKPHRRTIRLKGVNPGFNQLRLTLTVSQVGDVLDADAGGDKDTLKFWPQLQDEVRQWKFTPFVVNGQAVTAEVEEYIDLVPPERVPTKHAAAPVVGPKSKVAIMLQRSGCYGSCPSYKVTVTTEGIAFEGGGFVTAQGKHTDKVNSDDVRKLAKRFVAADFYSMESSYTANVTDSPTYTLSIEIDGHKKTVEDYVGDWQGMPAVITELEDGVDEFARTRRWIEGSEGLVQALQAENFDFQSFQSQVLFKEAATRGQTDTVRDLIAAGVPLYPLPAPKPKDANSVVRFDSVGMLTAAGRHSEVLEVLLNAGVSKSDQRDKDLALVAAARSGNLEAAKALIAYGADPNADLSRLVVTETSGGMTLSGPGDGSVLIYAAGSGNPELVREILSYHPDLEKKGHEGKTAIFAAGDYRNGDKEGARVRCVRLLAEAGANVNERDKDGNTPLHATFLTDVEEELLRLGAEVNARNNDGETPIFTTVDDDAIPLLIKHGADLNVRNKKGETIVQSARKHGPGREEALRKALEELTQGSR